MNKFYRPNIIKKKSLIAIKCKAIIFFEQNKDKKSIFAPYFYKF